ncbi:MAG TPA: hypothetical protein VIQ29_22585 [Ancylobacter sp.]
MSAEDNREIEPQSARWERSQQTAHWREIGISAVAAAALYAADNKPVPEAARAGAAPTEDAEAKVVTLRDIEFFAA